MRTIRLVMFLLLAIGVGGGLLAVSSSASAQSSAEPSEDSAPTYLFVQQATGGTLDQIAAGEWELTLTGVFPQTVYFTDRPVRQAGTLPTAAFLELDGLFDGDDPPNAAVELADGASEGDDVLVVELLAPIYDPVAGTLSYTVKQIEESGAGGVSLPGEFGHVSLFIDEVSLACAIVFNPYLCEISS